MPQLSGLAEAAPSEIPAIAGFFLSASISTMSVPENVRLTVYTRVGCHLCDDMMFALQQLSRDWEERHSGRVEISIRSIDIDDDPGLQDRYGERVPVLMHGDRFICEHFLDAHALRDSLDEVLNGL